MTKPQAQDPGLGTRRLLPGLSSEEQGLWEPPSSRNSARSQKATSERRRQSGWGHVQRQVTLCVLSGILAQPPRYPHLPQPTLQHPVSQG